MFTGIIEEIGTVRDIQQFGGGKKISIYADKVLDATKTDDSIAINGVCQTVIEMSDKHFTVIAVEETLSKTTLGGLYSGKKVNLERAMTISTRLGGHIVQGHADCTGKIQSIEKLTTAILLKVNYPLSFAKFLVNTGSICIDGVSLTSAKVENDYFMVSIIPHTWTHTTLSSLKSGDRVNLEFDIIGKYVDRILNIKNIDNSKNSSIFNQYINQPFD